jgi:DNA repair photolyase
MKIINGKAIYSPKGKAAEYAEYACNFYVGCSNQCEYCYLRKGIGKETLGSNKPTLKKCFKDETHALEVFEKELKANLPELKRHGLFFSFTTDPMLPKTADLTSRAIDLCIREDISVKILTKQDVCSDSVIDGVFQYLYSGLEDKIAMGFTLTGHNELEPGASTNAERIEAMRELHDAGFKTWASIEPVIDFESSAAMIYNTFGFCDLYKIGLESGKRYKRCDVKIFMRRCFMFSHTIKIYFKDGLLKQAGILREDLPENYDKEWKRFQREWANHVIVGSK